MDNIVLQVMGKICAALRDMSEPWVLTGSMSFAMRGISLEPNDIDIQTNRAGAYEIERRLQQYIVQTVGFSGTEQIQSHFGKLMIDGVRVEIMGDVQKRMPDGSWEDPISIQSFREYLQVGDVTIPVLTLEYEIKAYRTLGRHERAQLLEDWLKTHSG